MQLYATYHQLASTTQATKTTHAIVLDFKKAFSEVFHALLMQKLNLIPNIHPKLEN